MSDNELLIQRICPGKIHEALFVIEFLALPGSPPLFSRSRTGSERMQEAMDDAEYFREDAARAPLFDESSPRERAAYAGTRFCLEKGNPLAGDGRICVSA